MRASLGFLGPSPNSACLGQTQLLSFQSAAMAETVGAAIRASPTLMSQAFQILPGLLSVDAIALRVSTIHWAQLDSSW
jgi:hypothetical protein